MGKIYYILGKSATGKDHIYQALRTDPSLELHGVVMYTTRPKRANEENGKDYFFISDEEVKQANAEGKIIEIRTYQTVHGPWSYLTMDDGQIDLEKADYLIIGVLTSYCSIRDYYGTENVVPLYIEVEDGVRLERALKREREQTVPRYAELCRRYLADCEDFTEEKLNAAGIITRYENNQMIEACIENIRQVILSDR